MTQDFQRNNIFDLLAIDSVKMRANASYKQSKNMEGIEKEKQKIRRRLGELLRGVEKGREAEEREALKYRQARLVEAKAVLEKRIAEEAAGKSQKEAEQIAKQEKINITDPDAAIMEQANGERNPAYSVTTSSDVGGDIITHFQVNEKDNDSGALLEVVEGSRESSGERHAEVEADSGFASKEIVLEMSSDFFRNRFPLLTPPVPSRSSSRSLVTLGFFRSTSSQGRKRYVAFVTSVTAERSACHIAFSRFAVLF